MKLQELFKKLPIDENYNFEIDNICTNTKKADDKSLFVALVGTKTDTHDEKFINEAYENGCRAFVTQKEVKIPSDAVQFVVENSRKTLGLIASTFYGHPSKDLKIIGVTGTKGKTSITFILKEMLESMGKKCAVIGTSGAHIKDEHIELNNTTPDPITLQQILKKAVDEKIEYIAMEVSSQAMKQWRVMGARFLVTIFTNISEDHIGPLEHKDFDEYMSWKRRFLMLAKKVIMNSDDEHFEEMKAPMKNKIVTVGKNSNDFKISDISLSSFKLNGREINTNLHGKYNMYNLALAISTLNEIGYRMDEIVKHTDNIFIPGRMEVVKKNDRKFVIDYAHNKLSVKSLLEEIKSWSPNKLIVVVGTVGGRTFERRHEIPEAVNDYADYVIFTSDNPDFEDPQKICEEMKKNSTIETEIVVDRADAIKRAYEISNPGDIIVVSGKGDETHQLIEGKKIPYSDKEEINKL